MSDANTVKVWDPLVRIGHWLLVAGFVIAYASGDEFPQVHAFAGYLVAAVLIIRILWGFAGPAHARFRNFVRGPETTLTYLGEVAAHRDRRYLGHNPAGAAMIVALLLCLAAVTGSGLYLDLEQGDLGAPARAAVSNPIDTASSSRADNRDAAGTDHESDRKAQLSAWAEFHEVGANLALLLIAVHVAGVLHASREHHENLVRAMVTGQKRPLGEKDRSA